MRFLSGLFVALLGCVFCARADACASVQADVMAVQVVCPAGSGEFGVGFGVVHRGFVYITIEGELELVLPVEALEFEVLHGKLTTSVTIEGKEHIIIMDKPIL